MSSSLPNPHVPSVSRSLSTTPPSSSTDENRPPETAFPTTEAGSEAACATRSAHSALYNASLSSGLSSLYGDSSGGGGTKLAALAVPVTMSELYVNGLADYHRPTRKMSYQCRYM